REDGGCGFSCPGLYPTAGTGLPPTARGLPLRLRRLAASVVRPVCPSPRHPGVDLHLRLPSLPRAVLLLEGFAVGCENQSPEESFHEAARKNEEFLCEILAGPNLQALLNPECPPWSSDIKPLLHGEEAGPKRARLSARSREKLLLELSKELDEIVAALEALKAQCPFPREDTACPGLSTALQTLKLAASDFVQLIVAFGEVFENELREPCRRAAPQLNACGHLFPAVHRGLALCSQVVGVGSFSRSGTVC
uniref:HAUS augmin like complex subunit 7 n=1 Tax=Sphenodon punctatus TaxID=8508 RepID=A0A8D0HDG9_SPHPU